MSSWLNSEMPKARREARHLLEKVKKEREGKNVAIVRREKVGNAVFLKHISNEDIKD